MANININSVMIGGRLTHDIELNVTPTGTHVTQFVVAINRMKEGTDFVRCVAWKQSADYLDRYAHKGDAVIVEGRIEVDQYQNKDGKNTTVAKVVANRVTLIPKNNADQQRNECRSDDNPYRETHENNDEEMVILSDDLPF